MAASLPPGWEARVHHDGRRYYVNHTTKTTSSYPSPRRRRRNISHDQTSADTYHNFSAGGAMTNALLKALKDNPLPLYPDLFRALHANLRKKGFRQRPQLTSSQPFDVSNRVFSLTDGFVPNHNAVYGVPPGAKHRHRRRRRGRRGTGGLEGVLAAGLGAGILASVFG